MALSNTELLFLDQVGGLPLTAGNRDLFTAVENHTLSCVEEHRPVFLAHLRIVNPKLAARIQKAVNELAWKEGEKQRAFIAESRRKRDEKEREYRKAHGKDWVLGAVREITPRLCGLRCAHRVYIQKVTAQEAIDFTLSWLMQYTGSLYSSALPRLLEILEEMRGTTAFSIDPKETFHLCATEKDRRRIISSLRAEAKKTMKGYELIVNSPARRGRT